MLLCMIWRVIAILAVASGIAASGALSPRAQQQRPLQLESATIDKDGRVHLRWAGKPEQVAPRDRDGYCEASDDETPHCEDAGANQLQISSDRLGVGWVAEYNGCCQSYPLPLVLVIAHNGRIAQRIQPGRPVFDWRFEDGDRLVALYTDTPHFAPMPEFELYDTRTGKQLASWDGPKSSKAPRWAEPLEKNLR
jgi:hypothetical protein